LFLLLGAEAVTAIVKLANIFQHISGRCVLENISLCIEAGESFALLGPNGAGKTLLLRLIMGLDRPSAGRIEVLGKDLAHVSPVEMIQLRRSVGMVMQGGSLLNGLSVIENLILPLRASGFSTDRMQRTARLIMTQLRLDGLENIRPYELSGGLSRKVELARALIRRPPLLLWDELLDGLDPASVSEIEEHLQREKKTYNMTLIFSTHQPGGALTIASRIGVLESGRLLFTGTQEGLEAAEPRDLELGFALRGRL
jgi:ABC-type multidrug transport system ATPase subunit